MKPFLLVSIVAGIFFSSLHAQNVGIGIGAPHGSALLDLTSTNKGLLPPRMTTALRNSISKPATGLLVYDSVAKGLYHYNGTAWAAVAGSGGFSLPYEASVNLPTAGLKITNAGFGAAIHVVTQNDFGMGLYASNTTPYGYSISSYARSPNAAAVFATGDSATAVKAASTKGIAVDARSTDSSAIVASIIKGANTDPVIMATHAGSGNALYATSATGNAVRAVTSSNIGFAAVYGLQNGPAGAGIQGEAHFAIGVGVYGSSNIGTGVRGYSESNRGVMGQSVTGTALYGTSTSGYGLEVLGKVKISGGNTNPAAGALLTSDASGNATWVVPQQQKVAFKATGVGDAHQFDLILGGPYGSPIKLEFKNEQYDFGSDYNLYAGTVNGSSSSFTAPVNGVYHFDAAVTFIEAAVIPYTSITVYVKLSRNSIVSTISKGTNEISDTENIFAQTSTDHFLFAGDRIWVEVEQWNLTTIASPLEDKPETVFFNGHLVFAQ